MTGTGFDDVLPVINEVNYIQPVQKQPISIQAKITDFHSGLIKNSTKLFIRKGGDVAFNSRYFTEKNSSDSIFVGEIPGDWVTSHGIEYYIEATDSTENTAGDVSAVPYGCSDREFEHEGKHDFCHSLLPLQHKFFRI